MIPPDPAGARRWPVLNRMGTLLLIAPALVLSAWALESMREAREAARESTCRSQLKQYGLALLNYHSAYGCFPRATIADEGDRPVHSWRVAHLLDWEDHDLHGKYNLSVPWDHPANAKLASYDTAAFFFWCPSGDGRKTKITDYVAVVGPHTAWPTGGCRRLREITDGPSSTILVVEVTGSGIHWMEPRDVALEDLLLRGKGSNHPRHFNALFADGSVHKIRKDINRETLSALITIDGGERIDPQSWNVP